MMISEAMPIYRRLYKIVVCSDKYDKSLLPWVEDAKVGKTNIIRVLLRRVSIKFLRNEDPIWAPFAVESFVMRPCDLFFETNPSGPTKFSAIYSKTISGLRNQRLQVEKLTQR